MDADDISPEQLALNVALSEAVRDGQNAKAAELLKSGANPEWQTDDIFGFTALVRATRNNRLSLMRLLLTHGARLKGRCKSRWTALHWAAESGNLDAFRLLVEEYQADVQNRSGDGMTPLQTAQRSGPRAAAVVEYLKSKEARGS